MNGDLNLPAQTAKSPISFATANAGMSVGMDIENVDGLPWSGNPRSESFYQDHFTPREMEYCLRQTNPRMAFCGLWCAKEAALKCGNYFAGREPVEIEIHHDEKGQPGLSGIQAGKVFLSLSHSESMCMALCILEPINHPIAPAR